MPTLESGTDAANDALISTDPFNPSMPSQLDFGELSQESFDLMLQTLSYEVSEPVMCKSFSLSSSDDEKNVLFLSVPCEWSVGLLSEADTQVFVGSAQFVNATDNLFWNRLDA
jgi:hypothetical protein